MKEQLSGAQNRQASLVKRIARLAGDKNRLDTGIAGLSLHRFTAPTEPASYNHPPSICLIGQGRKRVLLGKQAYMYDADRFLISSVNLPLVAEIIEASEEHPYLGLTLELDLQAIARLMLDHRPPSSPRSSDPIGIAVGRVSASLVDAFVRLLDLLDQPEDIPALAPLIQHEISYRLLKSEQGPRLRHMTAIESHSHQIARAIEWLKNNFDKAFRVEELASKAGMSTSNFHQHFRAMTTMSPLQYQKRLRLNEARQRMLTGHLDAATAAFEVGYQSPSQFSREYRRFFGAPPLRDIKTLQQTVDVAGFQ
jgi:AraC-like DNA-binding protein